MSACYNVGRCARGLSNIVRGAIPKAVAASYGLLTLATKASAIAIKVFEEQSIFPELTQAILVTAFGAIVSAVAWKSNIARFRFPMIVAGVAIAVTGVWSLFKIGEIVLGVDHFVIVHDNKYGEPRLGMVTMRGDYMPVNPHNNFTGPFQDFESLALLPEHDNTYVACTSGPQPRCSVFTMFEENNQFTARNISSFDLFAPSLAELTMLSGFNISAYGSTYKHNIEGFALGPRYGESLYTAYWAHRGSSTRSNWMMEGVFDIGKYRLLQSKLYIVSLHVPVEIHQNSLPVPSNLRTISDIFVAQDGHMYLTAASDPNNDFGPFSSHIYESASILRPVFSHQRKVEGLTQYKTGKFVVVTDGEALGSEICTITPDRDLKCHAIKSPGDQPMHYSASGVAHFERSFWQRLKSFCSSLWG